MGEKGKKIDLMLNKSEQKQHAHSCMKEHYKRAIKLHEEQFSHSKF